MGFIGNLWESVKSLNPFDKNEPYKDIKLEAPVAPRAGDAVSAQTLISSTPVQNDWWNDPRVIPQETSTGFLGSLWDGLKTATSAVGGVVKGAWEEVKEIAPEAVKLYGEVKTAGSESLSRVMPKAEIPKTDFQVSTPYQRDSNTSIPSILPPAGAVGGLPLPLLLGGLALFVLLFMKGKKK